MNRNNFWLGVLLGLVLPLIGMYLYSLLKLTNDISFYDFIYLLKENHSMIPKVISLGLIVDIPLITYYKNRKHQSTLKGIFLTIVLYGSIAIMYKLNVI